jgi:hypothetical protein
VAIERPRLRGFPDADHRLDAQVRTFGSLARR